MGFCVWLWIWICGGFGLATGVLGFLKRDDLIIGLKEYIVGGDLMKIGLRLKLGI